MRNFSPRRFTIHVFPVYTRDSKLVYGDLVSIISSTRSRANTHWSKSEYLTTSYGIFFRKFAIDLSAKHIDTGRRIYLASRYNSDGECYATFALVVVDK